MPSPPPGAPSAAAAEDGEECIERPWPPRIKMKLAPYAMYRVFGGMGPKGDIAAGAYVGLHFVLYFVRFLSLSPVPERALFWGSVHAVVQPICFTATVLILCAFVRWYMAVDGVYVEEYEPPPRLLQRPTAAAAAATVVEQLPPPPPQMDMCAAVLDQGSKVLLSSVKARIKGTALLDQGKDSRCCSPRSRIRGVALLDQGKDSRCRSPRSRQGFKVLGWRLLFWFQIISIGVQHI